MVETILQESTALVSQARATSELHNGNPLRTERMLLEHRQLRLALEQILEVHDGYSKIHLHLVRLVNKLLGAFSMGSNGRRYWIDQLSDLPPEAKTSLVLLNAFMRKK